jgi:hypothetical protein
MDGALVQNLSHLVNLVLADGRALIMTSGLEILPITVVALILVLFVAKLVKRKTFRTRRSGTHKRASGRRFEKQESPELKPCPNCTDKLPLSAIICNTCDYNFLAARPGRGQKMLPSPEPIIHGVPDPQIASPGL